MALHWTLALLILIQIGLGWCMNEYLPDHSAIQGRVEGVHISLGLTILLLVLVRIGVRATHRPPPLPDGMRPWEKLLAKASHLAFYLLMLLMPLTGWALVSAGQDPISFWGLANWPHLPGVAFLAAPENRPLRHSLKHFHVYVLIWLVLANLVLHVAGALKAQFGGHPVMWRMLPFVKQR